MEETTKKNVPDESRVNIQEEPELRQWADKFGVSKAAIVRAVETVGTLPKDVNEFLNGRSL